MARRRDPWLQGEIAHYLATGESDALGQTGPAEDIPRDEELSLQWARKASYLDTLDSGGAGNRTQL